METEKVMLLSGLGFVIVVGAFILFGPTIRTKRKVGQICGLVNLGNTCFLNALLQALGSCSAVVEWLSHHCSTQNTFIEALHSTILVINGQHPDLCEDPYTPGDVIKCLYSKGWTIAPGEHDVHELLNVIMTTVEEEIQHTSSMKVSTLADVLDMESKPGGSRLPTMSLPSSSNCHEIIGDVRSSTDTYCDNDKGVGDEQKANTQAVKHEILFSIDSEAETTPNYKNILSNSFEEPLALKFNNCVQKNVGRPISARSVRSDITEYRAKEHTDPSSQDSGMVAACNLKRRDIKSRSSAAAGIIRAASCSAVVKNSHATSLTHQGMWSMPPYEGLLAGQTQCTRCRYKSPVKYDKFGCISFPLPLDKGLYSCKITLHQLLEKFVSPELINNVVCENCVKKNGSSDSSSSSIFKSCYFGKLPTCLIFHIQRTIWQSSGMSKRHDYIEFPEIFSMYPYSYSEMQKKLNEFSPGTKKDAVNRKVPDVIDRFKHLYRLSAVIVHKGDVEYGHFITYRRSPVRPNSWFYISDSEVQESSLSEVLQNPAYMLFYNRCQEN